MMSKMETAGSLFSTTDIKKPTKAGFVVLIGSSNVGKSTLMNAMVGHKVSIVTPKIQTTRSRIRGICMHKNTQLVLVDTPGIFAPHNRLERAMVNAAWRGMETVDVCLLVHDCARTQIDDDTKKIIDRFLKNKQKISLILNKIDLVSSERLLARAAELSKMIQFERVFMISAQSGNGVQDLKKWLASQMPESSYLFDPDDLSDMPLRLLAAEILREKLFLNLHQELPYQLTVETDSWKGNDDGSVRVDLSIYVARNGHRGIVLGKSGHTLRRIGTSARLELEKTLGLRVHLFSRVKFRKDWMNEPAHFKTWDLDFNA